MHMKTKHPEQKHFVYHPPTQPRPSGRVASVTDTVSVTNPHFRRHPMKYNENFRLSRSDPILTLDLNPYPEP
jgi:hypothetical protein